MVRIESNPSALTQEEKALIAKAVYYSYTYGVGLIFLSNGTWDCSNTVGAKQFLDRLGIPEKK